MGRIGDSLRAIRLTRKLIGGRPPEVDPDFAGKEAYLFEAGDKARLDAALVMQDGSVPLAEGGYISSEGIRFGNDNPTVLLSKNHGHGQSLVMSSETRDITLATHYVGGGAPGPGAPTLEVISDDAVTPFGIVSATGLKVPAKVFAPDLPTVDPEVAGQLWNDAGTLKVSAG